MMMSQIHDITILKTNTVTEQEQEIKWNPKRGKFTCFMVSTYQWMYFSESASSVFYAFFCGFVFYVENVTRCSSRKCG